MPPSRFERQIGAQDWLISHDKAYLLIRREVKIDKITQYLVRRTKASVEMSSIFVFSHLPTIIANHSPAIRYSFDIYW